MSFVLNGMFKGIERARVRERQTDSKTDRLRETVRVKQIDRQITRETDSRDRQTGK